MYYNMVHRVRISVASVKQLLVLLLLKRPSHGHEEKRKFACQQFQHHVDVKERPCCNLMPSEKETEKS